MRRRRRVNADSVSRRLPDRSHPERSGFLLRVFKRKYGNFWCQEERIERHYDTRNILFVKTSMLEMRIHRIGAKCIADSAHPVEGTSEASGQTHSLLKRKQLLLAPEPSSISSEFAVLVDNTVTGNDYRDTV